MYIKLTLNLPKQRELAQHFYPTYSDEHAKHF